jgi:hypothetical protein
VLVRHVRHRSDPQLGHVPDGRAPSTASLR